jgi:hypothetical protein
MILVADETLTITPETKLKKLLEVYPELEDVLIKMSPSFAKLKNPLLRKTVAKVATLQQIANVGGIPVSELVNKLRDAAGVEAEFDSSESGSTASEPVPDWFDEARVISAINADKILDVGNHPLEVVGSALRDLEDGQILKLTASFTPDPLIEKFRAKGYRIWTRRTDAGAVECYITSA